MKIYALSEETLNKVLAYLGSKPFAEVTTLIPLVQAAQLVVNNDGTPFEVAETATVAALETEEVSAASSNGSGKEATA